MPQIVKTKKKPSSKSQRNNRMGATGEPTKTSRRTHGKRKIPETPATEESDFILVTLEKKKTIAPDSFYIQKHLNPLLVKTLHETSLKVQHIIVSFKENNESMIRIIGAQYKAKLYKATQDLPHDIGLGRVEVDLFNELAQRYKEEIKRHRCRDGQQELHRESGRYTQKKGVDGVKLNSFSHRTK